MKTDRLITLIVTIVIAGTVLFFAVRLVINAYSNRPLTMKASAKTLNEEYSAAIANEKDVNKLTSDAIKYIRGNQIDCALINLKQATLVDPKYKESWFWLGYVYLQNNQPQEALDALKKAESIDPIDPRTYQYLAIAYEQIGDSDSASKAQEKFEYLSKQK